MHPIFTILFFIIFGSAAIAGISAAPWLPTKPKDREHLLKSLKLPSPDSSVVDLGCGDGSLLFAVARQFPEAKCIGYDISLFPLLLGWIRKLLKWRAYRNVHIRFGNLFTQNVSNADIVFIFLLSKSYPRLITNLKRDLRDDAIAIVEAWPLPDIKPTWELQAEKRLPMFGYTGSDLRRAG